MCQVVRQRIRDGHVTRGAAHDQGHGDARFEGPESEIDLGPRDGHEQEFDAWQWVTLAELPALVVPFKRKVYLSVIEQLGAVAGSG